MLGVSEAVMDKVFDIDSVAVDKSDVVVDKEHVLIPVAVAVMVDGTMAD